MTPNQTTLEILLVEDDPEYLKLLAETLPAIIGDYNVVWDRCEGFDEALRRIELRRYDLVVTDIYQARPGHTTGADATDDRARDIISAIRSKRFCPVVAFTAASPPDSIKAGPFIKFADKSAGNDQIIACVEEILKTGVPGIARRIHDDIDRAAGSYLWGFLEQEWERLSNAGMTAAPTLERVVRRRAALQIGRLDLTGEAAAEIAAIDGAEFYIHPPIAATDLRLGEIVKRKGVAEYRVVVNPHCHLAVQSGAVAPRAEFVVTIRTVEAKALFEKHPLQAKKEERRLSELRRCLQSPAAIGQPEGRYWFLPGLLDMPDLYCDFLQIDSLATPDLNEHYERFAVLDAPFAEALQACFTGFYSTVGLVSLELTRFRYLL